MLEPIDSAASPPLCTDADAEVVCVRTPRACRDGEYRGEHRTLAVDALVLFADVFLHIVRSFSRLSSHAASARRRRVAACKVCVAVVLV